MTIVIQPNVITHDQMAGVQTGELVLITETGAESLHTAPRGLFMSQYDSHEALPYLRLRLPKPSWMAFDYHDRVPLQGALTRTS